MADICALIIDDDAFNLEVLERLLTLENVKVLSVQDPRTLEESLSTAAQIDLVFLDLELPGGGYQLFKVLQEWLGTAVPIVAYTVHTSEIDVARQVGFHSFLGKPIMPWAFPQQLSRILGGEPVWEIP